MRDGPIAILGGTGDQGLGLALRFCAAGRAVVIGSRTRDRAVAAAANVLGQVPGARVEGCENADATARAGIVILSVPCASRARSSSRWEYRSLPPSETPHRA